MPNRFRVFSASLLFLFLFTVPSFAQQAQPVKEWTFLVYLNADNNLYDFGLKNFAEMERVGSSDQVNIVVQLDPEPRQLPTTRYYVTKNPSPVVGKPTSQVVQQMGETDMGDPKTLADFLAWGVKTYPAKHYAVVIWNHGNGWQGVSYDEQSGNHLDMPKLRMGLEGMNQVIAQQRRIQRPNNTGLIDIINFDACLMASIEVGYELRNQAKVLIGSQFLEPGEGEDYSTMLAPLVQKPQMTASDFAQVMVYQYSARYATAGGGDINYIALDLTKLANFTAAFNQVATGMLHTTPDIKGKIMRGFHNPSYGGFDMIDAMKSSQAASTADANLSKLLEGLVGMYGYPADAEEMLRTGTGMARTLGVIRYSPGVVYFRSGQSGAWQQTPLIGSGDGTFKANIPSVRGIQYFVSKTNMRGIGGQMYHEAVSTIMRDGNDPIVFHNKFPDTSPVICDSHTKQTHGATGMSLYSLAGIQAAQGGAGDVAGSIRQEYKLLQFATTGAPAWTQLFGF